ncbi:hypothetical protein BCR33DRAFT_751785 [Rhizoclosmatium globosum]|uniref:Uncharacterized protein n=1 Tax=Rhizoclosmatium globosum TaxID=329046 RepID=A0A1Y1ZWF2_9FUNG|nr:hypothetical protein BCR33DRAFT_751785 [Rhizoclosmatium globosum]|eukprot:ORY14095.1 hypothetical protein BCR33DRAFT_751785 [Rhizoclosmatium globosum]
MYCSSMIPSSGCWPQLWLLKSPTQLLVTQSKQPLMLLFHRTANAVQVQSLAVLAQNASTVLALWASDAICTCPKSSKKRCRSGLYCNDYGNCASIAACNSNSCLTKECGTSDCQTSGSLSKCFCPAQNAICSSLDVKGQCCVPKTCKDFSGTGDQDDGCGNKINCDNQELPSCDGSNVLKTANAVAGPRILSVDKELRVPMVNAVFQKLARTFWELEIKMMVAETKSTAIIKNCLHAMATLSTINAVVDQRILSVDKELLVPMFRNYHSKCNLFFDGNQHW